MIEQPDADDVIGLAAHELREGRLQINAGRGCAEIDASPSWLTLLVDGDTLGLSLAQLDHLARERLGSSDFMAFVHDLVSQGLVALHPAGAARPVVDHFQDSVRSARAIARARLRWPRQPDSEGWGRGPSAAVATARALGEAVERHAFFSPGSCLRLARGEDVCDREAEPAFVAHLATQYLEPGFPLTRFSLADERCWLPTACLRTGATRWIPADAIHPVQALPAPGRDRRCAVATSSGFACAPSLAAAVEHGLHELIERDAFMRHWLAQRGGIEIARDSLPASVDAVARELEDAGCAVHLQCLTLGLAPVWLAIVQHAALGFTCTGAAAGANDQDALDRALAEAHAAAMARVATADGAAVSPVDPTAVANAAGHAALYGDRRYFRRADALMACRERLPFRHAAPDGRLRARTASDVIGARQSSVIDFSPTSLAFAPGGWQLHTVRVIVPSLAPITFGARLLPLAFGAAMPGAAFPHPFS